MEKAHQGMNIQAEHFDAIAKHLANTLAELAVEQDDIDAVIEKSADLLRISCTNKEIALSGVTSGQSLIRLRVR